MASSTRRATSTAASDDRLTGADGFPAPGVRRWTGARVVGPRHRVAGHRARERDRLLGLDGPDRDRVAVERDVDLPARDARRVLDVDRAREAVRGGLDRPGERPIDLRDVGVPGSAPGPLERRPRPSAPSPRSGRWTRSVPSGAVSVGPVAPPETSVEPVSQADSDRIATTASATEPRRALDERISPPVSGPAVQRSGHEPPRRALRWCSHGHRDPIRRQAPRSEGPRCGRRARSHRPRPQREW